MKKKLLILAISLLSVMGLTACADKTDKNNGSKTNLDYTCYRFEDSVDESGYTNRTYYYVNQEGSFSLTFRVNRNHYSEDFHHGTAVISNDALNYMRYSLIDTEGNTIIGYDDYAEFHRLGSTVYFSYTSIDGALCGVFNDEGKELIDEKYNEISLFPETDEIFFMCRLDDDTYDIYRENGKVIAEGISIPDISSSEYVNRFSKSGKGLFIFENNGRLTLLSESTGEIIAEVDSSAANTLPDSYLSENEDGVNVMYIISADNDAVYPLGAEYTGCMCYATKDYRYIYDNSYKIVAVFNDKGVLKEEPEDATIHMLHIADTYSLIYEYPDKYVLKGAGNKQLMKFDKDTYTLLSIVDYGFGIRKGEDVFLYDFSGNVLFKDLEYNGSYVLKNGSSIIHFDGTDTVISSETCREYVDTLYGKYYLLKDELTKYQVTDLNFRVIFEFAADDFLEILKGTGYHLIKLTDGLYTPDGKKFEFENPELL